MNKPKIIVILGPTSSGKSAMAIKLARKFGGEIVSADSRQIYRGMDLGTGKVTKAEQKLSKHWMLDVVSPRSQFSAAQFKKKAEKIIADIVRRGKVPIICGGTGFWIQAIVDNVVFPEVKPDPVLRSKLRNKSAAELFTQLKKLDPVRAQDIDRNNPVRLIRAIEICKALGRVPNTKYQIPNTKYDSLQIGIELPKEELHARIHKRLLQRLRRGMLRETERLHFDNNISWKRLESFGLEYRQMAFYLQGKITLQEMREKILQENKDYAKRQMTWFRKDPRIVWVKKEKDVLSKTKTFLNKKIRTLRGAFPHGK